MLGNFSGNWKWILNVKCECLHCIGAQTTWHDCMTIYPDLTLSKDTPALRNADPSFTYFADPSFTFWHRIYRTHLHNFLQWLLSVSLLKSQQWESQWGKWKSFLLWTQTSWSIQSDLETIFTEHNKVFTQNKMYTVLGVFPQCLEHIISLNAFKN